MQKTSNVVRPGFWRLSAGEFKKVKSIAGAGMLSALQVVLGFFTLYLGPLLRIGFGFIPAAMSAYLYGPLVAGLASAAMDVIGFVLHPTGPYFIGFTFNAFLSGFIYGCFLYKKPVKLWRVALACASTLLLFSVVLNPIWFAIMYERAYTVVSAANMVKNVIMIPINTALLYTALRWLEKHKNTLLSKR